MNFVLWADILPKDSSFGWHLSAKFNFNISFWQAEIERLIDPSIVFSHKLKNRQKEVVANISFEMNHLWWKTINEIISSCKECRLFFWCLLNNSVSTEKTLQPKAALATTSTKAANTRTSIYMICCLYEKALPFFSQLSPSVLQNNIEYLHTSGTQTIATAYRIQTHKSFHTQNQVLHMLLLLWLWLYIQLYFVNRDDFPKLTTVVCSCICVA